MQPDSDLKIAFEAIQAKQVEQDYYWSVYDGDVEVMYVDPRLANVFPNMKSTFTENWSQLIVDSVNDRMVIDRFQVSGADELDDMFASLWRRTQLAQTYADVHLNALVTGEGFIVVGALEDGTPEAYWNDSRRMHMEYESAHPNTKRFAAKLYQDDEGVWTMILYYPDRIEFYTAPRTTSKTLPSGWKGFQQARVVDNPLEVIPVFHFRKENRRIISELVAVAPLQNVVNKLIADMMVSAEYAAFPQRYIIAQAASGGPLKNAPNLVWEIPAGDGMGQPVSVGQLPAAELGNYINALNRTTSAIAAVSKTPKFYFDSMGGVPSGEALRAVEAPLVKKVERYQNRFEPSWVECMICLVSMEGVTVERDDVDVLWREAHTKTPLSDAQYVQTMTSSGLPLTTALRTVGWQESQLDQMEADKSEEATNTADASTIMLSQAMLNQEKVIA